MADEDTYELRGPECSSVISFLSFQLHELQQPLCRNHCGSVKDLVAHSEVSRWASRVESLEHFDAVGLQPSGDGEPFGVCPELRLVFLSEGPDHHSAEMFEGMDVRPIGGKNNMLVQ
jgi:hypothetical protein